MAENYEAEAFTEDYFRQYNSTISNGEARIPICFCIDTSTSMSLLMNKESDFDVLPDSGPHMSDGKRVRRVRLKSGVAEITPTTELRRVLADMLRRMKNDPIIRNSAVVSIITFDRFADCIQEFSDVGRISEQTVRSITPKEEMTNTSKGIEMSLERLDRFRDMNTEAGNESYRPVFILMSDGAPTDGEFSRRAGREVRRRSEEGQMNVIPIAIGYVDSTGESFLRNLSKDSRLYRMKTEADFNEVFNKITSRITRTAAVISVDEGIGQLDVDEPINVADASAAASQSTQYGESISNEDFAAFLDGFMGGGD